MVTLSADSATASFKTEDVVLVRRRPGQSGGSYDVFSLEESTEDGQPPFKLAQSQVADVPQDIPSHLLVEQVPEHLLGGPSRKVHVLVSTGSGTGRAAAFYEAALRPLLGALGLTAASEGAGAISGAEGKNRYNLVTTTDGQSIREFGRTLADENDGTATKDDDNVGVMHTIVILSGDGGIVELLNSKAPADGASSSEGRDRKRSPQPPLVAILPLGTGNALFNSLHKLVIEPPAPSSSLVQALRTLLTGAAAPLPSFRADFSPGSRLITYQEGQQGSKKNGDASADSGDVVEVEEHADAVSHLRGAIVASYGFHSQLVWESDTPAYRRHGAQRFGMVAKELLEESHAYDAVVEITTTNVEDGSSSSSSSYAKPEEGKRKKKKINRDRHAYVLATLVSNLEKTFTISPASRPLDGRLRLVHFGDVGGERTMEVMMRAYDGGKHVGMRWGEAPAAAEAADDEVGVVAGAETEKEEEQVVGYEEVGEVKITTRELDPRWRKVCIDGTIVELPQGGSMTVTVEDKGMTHLRILVDRSVIS
ncbi:putative diacylglycerol kinase catalytic domain-containing protein [Eutypa lata UCREL1]|uniref:Putative diacylglycerol kinase catalytic domain-containing protein n=1 Tax=Eutypa lata (strain UCR-EL1) TaxID=1287681 RepID=M7SNX4_EUTLA|nr:putative diacylglycerol kinase catalytic domain-containing protein [Eutypa lata UCREL1]